MHAPHSPNISPIVTAQDIDDNIVSESYFTAADGVRGATPGGLRTYVPREAHKLLTFCVLEFRNGFTVTGQSVFVSADNFDSKIARSDARQDAINQAWPIIVYARREKLAQDCAVG